MLSAAELAGIQEGSARLPADALADRLAELAKKHPDDPRVWFALGTACQRLDRLAEAVHAFDRVLALEPGHLNALNAKAGILGAQGRRREAFALLETAHRRLPGEPTLLVNMGYLLEQEMQWQQALEFYEAALAIDASHVGARMNRGYLLTLMGRILEAVANNREFVAFHPTVAVAHFNLAESLLAAMRTEDALAACDAALDLAPGMANAHLTRALALAELGRCMESAEALARARSLDPKTMERASHVFEPNKSMPPPLLDPEAIYLHRGLRHLGACDWSRRDAFLADLEASIIRTIDRGEPVRDFYYAYYVPATPLAPTVHRRIMASFAQQFEATARSHRPSPYVYSPRAGGRIRIGYVSPDFREHLNARLTLPIFRGHDRRRFEVYLYSLHADDGSDIRRQVEAAADKFADVSNLDSGAIADLIHADGIDILVDLAGLTTDARPHVFSLKPAPVQVSYLGFPGTLGADYIQYRITDRVATPPSQRDYWSEALIFLPDTFYIYDAAEPLVDVPITRADCGLPETGIVFCAFHNHYKIDPGIFDSWMRILHKVPGSVIWLAGRDHVAMENLKREATVRGIDVARLCFAPIESRERYRARFRLADLYLDTRYFTAMTTACDALWAGLPLITCPGEGFTSRVSASLLTAIGLDDCILPDLDAYENTAVELASDPIRLAGLRERLARNRLTTSLFDTEARVRQLEAAFGEMWRRNLAGLPPESFDVKRQAKPDFGNRWH